MVWSRSRLSFSAIMAVLLIPILVGVASSQGLPQSPYSAPSVVRGGGLDLAPSNPQGLPSGLMGPRSSDSILLTPQLFQGILPQIPNLQVGYVYSFGKNVKSGRLTTDFLLPISLSRDSTAFGEAHGEFQDFWKTVQGGANNRVDLSFGGGFRTIRGDNTLLGINGFFDTTRLGGRWYSSGSVGFEMAALLPGNDAVDLNFNWYGSLFKSSVLANAFRRGPQNYDFGAGYSHELYNGGPDLRLNVTGYRFSAGSGVYGVRGGAELKTRDGMFSVKYEAGDDRVNGTYHTVGGLVNVGLQLENLLSGQSPFVKPEPIFRSPRNLRSLLTREVRRPYSQPASVVVARSVTGAGVAGPRVAPFALPLTLPTGVIPDVWTYVPIIGGPITPDELATVPLVVVEWAGGTADIGMHMIEMRLSDGGSTNRSDPWSIMAAGGILMPLFQVVSMWSDFVPLSTAGRQIAGIEVRTTMGPGAVWQPTDFEIRVGL